MSEARDAQQAEALSAILTAFDGGETRGRLYAPTGWGKTVVAAQVWDKVDGGGILVYVGPTRIGASQPAPTFLKYSRPDTRQLLVAGREPGTRGKRRGGLTVTRSMREIRAFLTDTSTARQIFTTDTSLAGVVAQVMRDNKLTADLLVVDEGHRNAAVRDAAGPDPVWATTATETETMPARRRLYMTATPRHWTGGERPDLTIISNDDEKLFGPVLYECTHDQAVEAGIILPPLPLALQATDDEIRNLFARNPKLAQAWSMAPDEVPYQEIAAHLAIFRARADGLPVPDAGGERYYPQRILVAFNYVADARAFTRRHGRVMAALGLTEQTGAYSIVGTTPMSTRDAIRRHVTDLEQDGRKLGHAVITQCHALTESFDLPDLDMLVVIEPRNSTVDCMQLMGRIARLPVLSSKQFAYVVTTDVLSPEEEDIEGSALVTICRALAEMSETFEHGLRKPSGTLLAGPGETEARILTMDGRPLPADMAARLTLVALDQPRRGWFERDFLPHLDAYIADHGTSEVPSEYVSPDGYRLGDRCKYIRAGWTGTRPVPLSDTRIGALDARGFRWPSRWGPRGSSRWYGEFIVHYRDHWAPANGPIVPRSCECPCGRYDNLGSTARHLRSARRRNDPDRYVLSEDQRSELEALGFDVLKGPGATGAEATRARYAEERRRYMPEISRRYTEEGQTIEQICEATGRSDMFVRRVLREAGVQTRTTSRRVIYPPDYGTQLRERYEAGASQGELVRAEGLARDTVRRLLRQAGTTFRDEPWKVQRDSEL